MNELLRDDIKNNGLGHAYLLLGDGAKTEAEAEAFAAAIHCLTPRDGEACGECRRCRQRLAGNFPELVTLAPAKSAYVKAQIVELLKYAALSTDAGFYRIFWLKNGDLLGETCSNILLKTLEEPSPRTIFLLTAENEDRLLETVLSRCRVLRYDESPAVAIEDEAVFETLSLVKKESLSYLLVIAEKYAKEWSKEELAAFFEAASALFAADYAHRRGGPRPRCHFSEQDWTEQELFAAWQWALTAPILLDQSIQRRLILENFLLAINRNGGTYGNNCWSTL